MPATQRMTADDYRSMPSDPEPWFEVALELERADPLTSPGLDGFERPPAELFSAIA